MDVLPFALRLAEHRLKELRGVPALRLGKMKDGPVITYNGNFVLDVNYGVIEDLEGLAARMSMIPRVFKHGIFDNLDELYLARVGGVEIVRRRQSMERSQWIEPWPKSFQDRLHFNVFYFINFMAVCMFNQTGEWKFIFTKSSDLGSRTGESIPAKNNAARTHKNRRSLESRLDRYFK